MEQTYKIGEAAALLNLKTYVLRFWETEFPQIAPLRTDKGQRLYTEKDLDLLRRIQFLLHEQGLTIDGARRALEVETRRRKRQAESGQPPFQPAEEDPAQGPANTQEQTNLPLFALVPAKKPPLSENAPAMAPEISEQPDQEPQNQEPLDQKPLDMVPLEMEHLEMEPLEQAPQDQKPLDQAILAQSIPEATPPQEPSPADALQGDAPAALLPSEAVLALVADLEEIADILRGNHATRKFLQ